MVRSARRVYSDPVQAKPLSRSMPIGAELFEGGAHLRVWAPRRRALGVLLEDEQREIPLKAERDGYFSGWVPGAKEGMLYRLRLDGKELAPDPASRFQPQGPWGPSQLVDASRYAWRDASWRGPSLEGQVLYEMHVGTFTPEGGWEAARRRLAELAELGVTLVELMPIAEFPGRFGWGYDGVNLFAPYHAYGSPDDFRRFVDAAHALRLGVILDVVYNHFGPDGNTLPLFSEAYASRRYETEWGPAVNFDGPSSGPVREFVVSNAAYWISEFHLDGLRLDATQNIYDGSAEHILAAISKAARAAATGRSLLLFAENQPQDVRLIRPIEQGGLGLDALWNDDFHHSAIVAMTGRREAYYVNYSGSPQELISSVKWGFLYQGQYYGWHRKPRGTPSLGIPAPRFVHYLDNHDQVANLPGSRRGAAFTSPGRQRAMTALLLLCPQTPLLFQGQEYGAESPFPYFADHRGELARAVAQGRRQFISQFPSQAPASGRPATIGDPSDPKLFRGAVLREDAGRGAWWHLHRDLLLLRRRDPVFRRQDARQIDGAVLGTEAFALRFFERGRNDRLLLVNLGVETRLEPAAEPLLAPPESGAWALLWSSEDPRYGGGGTPPLERPAWVLPPHCAIALGPSNLSDGNRA